MKSLKTHSRRSAFTLIELLVVIAIIALLIGILLPALGAARQTARSVVCLSLQKGLGTSQQVYAAENDDYYSSPVNVGARYLSSVIIPGEGVVTGAEQMEGESTSSTPTSVQDWISPIAGDEFNFPSSRAWRTAQIFEVLSCPEATQDSIVYSGGDAGDLDDFEQIIEERTAFRQVSYLMPTGFAHLGNYNGGPFANQSAADATTAYLRSLLDPLNGIDISSSNFGRMLSHPNSAKQPSGFRHRLDRVGTTISDKVIFADGTRYFDPTLGVLDFDPTPIATFGSFTSSSPIFDGSTAYGREFGDGTDPTNLLLSFRHKEGINTARFDGSASAMKQSEAWENPNAWHPTGTLWHDADKTPESIRFMEAQHGDRTGTPKIW